MLEIVSQVLNTPVFFGGNVSRWQGKETERMAWLPETQGVRAHLCPTHPPAARRPGSDVAKGTPLSSLGQEA